MFFYLYSISTNFIMHANICQILVNLKSEISRMIRASDFLQCYWVNSVRAKIPILRIKLINSAQFPWYFYRLCVVSAIFFIEKNFFFKKDFFFSKKKIY